MSGSLLVLENYQNNKSNLRRPIPNQEIVDANVRVQRAAQGLL